MVTTEEKRVLRKRVQNEASFASTGKTEAHEITKPTKKKKQEQKLRLPVYVSNEHNGALVNLHSAIRCGELSFSNVGVLHVDSHPDLMVPPLLPAKTVFNPRELHFQLAQSETGIAEFILPAVFAGHIDRVIWLRPAWSDQIRDGELSFHVGEAMRRYNVVGQDGRKGKVEANEEGEGPLRVTCRVPYFSDEQLCEAVENLRNAKPLQVLVTPQQDCTAGRCASFLFDGQVNPTSSHSSREWILDICLDYFSVNNPFRVDLETKVDAATFQVIQDVYVGLDLRWRRIEMERTLSTDEDFVDSHLSTQLDLKKAFDATLNRVYDMSSDSKPDARHPVVLELAAHFVNKEEVNQKAQAFVAFFCSAAVEIKELVKSCGPYLDLPHHRSDVGTISAMLEDLRRMLEDLQSMDAVRGRPKIVTIAKSSSDELDYTPVDQTQWILEQTLHMLESLYGDLEIDFDAEESEAGDTNNDSTAT